MNTAVGCGNESISDDIDLLLPRSVDLELVLESVEVTNTFSGGSIWEMLVGEDKVRGKSSLGRPGRINISLGVVMDIRGQVWQCMNVGNGRLQQEEQAGVVDRGRLEANFVEKNVFEPMKYTIAKNGSN